MKGKFIAFEGCEGSGKSTQLKLLAEYLIGHGVDFILTREPGGSEISEQIRGIILNGKNTDMCDECEALLYAAARVQHLKQTVMPALEDGKLVICDRYIYSSLAYQGYARGLGVRGERKRLCYGALPRGYDRFSRYFARGRVREKARRGRERQNGTAGAGIS